MTSLHWWSVVLLPATKTNLFWLNILQVIKTTYLTQFRISGIYSFYSKVTYYSQQDKMRFFFFLLFFYGQGTNMWFAQKNTAWSVPWQKFHIIIRFNFKIPLCFKIHVISIRIWSTVTFNLLRKYTFIPHREEGVGNTVSNSPEHFEF